MLRLCFGIVSGILFLSGCASQPSNQASAPSVSSRSYLPRPAPKPAECPASLALDPNAQPLIRLHAYHPAVGKESGACDVAYNVNVMGRTVDVTAQCTSKVFEMPSTSAVEQWIFNPRIINRESVSRCGVKTRVKYNLDRKTAKVIYPPYDDLELGVEIP